MEVADTELGIPKENYFQIFELFYTTKKGGSRVGLGLSEVYGIIRDHNGSIVVDSLAGHETTFIIHLPASKQGKENVASQKDQYPGSG